jgi:hypothetical protein
MPDSKGQYSSYPSRRRRAYDNDQEHEEPSRIPTALLIGIVVGILCVALNVALTFLNAPIYQAVVNEGSKVVSGNTYTLFGLGCLSFFIQLLACFIAGFIVGKVAIVRRLGFYAGIVAAAISYLASFAVRYIPNYPGNVASNTPVSGAAVGGGIATVIVFLIIWGLIGGLVGLWGARIATRSHPYYVGEPHE